MFGVDASQGKSNNQYPLVLFYDYFMKGYLITLRRWRRWLCY